MLIAVVLSLTLIPEAPRCLQLEVSAVGRSAHGSAIMVGSAPHALIRALDLLPDWVENTAAITTARVTRLEAAPAINVIPRRAAAVLDISFDQDALDDDALIDHLAQALGPRVELELLTTACVPRP